MCWMGTCWLTLMLPKVMHNLSSSGYNTLLVIQCKQVYSVMPSHHTDTWIASSVWWLLNCWRQVLGSRTHSHLGNRWNQADNRWSHDLSMQVVKSQVPLWNFLNIQSLTQYIQAITCNYCPLNMYCETVQRYLRNRPHTQLQAVCSVLTHLCLTYLCPAGLPNPTMSTKGSPKIPQGHYSFNNCGWSRMPHHTHSHRTTERPSIWTTVKMRVVCTIIATLWMAVVAVEQVADGGRADGVFSQRCCPSLFQLERDPQE